MCLRTQLRVTENSSVFQPATFQFKPSEGAGSISSESRSFIPPVFLVCQKGGEGKWSHKFYENY